MIEKNFVLASASPRRIDIMRSHGIDPLICPADIEENLPLVDGMTDTVMFLALKKAKAVESSNTNIQPGSIIIAADTVVYKDKIMGKPEDYDDAFKMLSQLRNT